MIERLRRLETFGTQLKLRPYDRANGGRWRAKGRCPGTQLKLRPYGRADGARCRAKGVRCPGTQLRLRPYDRAKGARCPGTQLKLRPYDRVEHASSRGKNSSETARDKRAAFVRAAQGVAV